MYTYGTGLQSTHNIKHTTIDSYKNKKYAKIPFSRLFTYRFDSLHIIFRNKFTIRLDVYISVFSFCFSLSGWLAGWLACAHAHTFSFNVCLNVIIPAIVCASNIYIYVTTNNLDKMPLIIAIAKLTAEDSTR